MQDSAYLSLMSGLRTAGGVVAGAAITLLLPFPVAVMFLAFGVVTGALVGASLPMWAVAVPLLACPLVGGLTTAVLRGGDALSNTVLGGLAGGLGASAVGTIVGLVFAVVMMGFTPDQGQTTDFSQVLLQMGLYGAGGGVAVGALLGSVGGGLASLARQVYRPATEDHR
jgi:hypothetical protein